MFPALAGMNRGSRGLPRLCKGVPRARGDEPDAEGKRVQRHGDFAIGLLLGHYAMKRDVAPIEFTGVPASSGRWSDNPSTRRDDDDDDARDTDSGAW